MHHHHHPPPPPCKLLGTPFSLQVQLLLFAITLSFLLFKRVLEKKRNRRTVTVWLLDISKQGLGSFILHAWNLVYSSFVYEKGWRWNLGFGDVGVGVGGGNMDGLRNRQHLNHHFSKGLSDYGGEGEGDGDDTECPLYFLSFFMDCTFGIFITYYLLKYSTEYARFCYYRRMGRVYESVVLQIMQGVNVNVNDNEEEYNATIKAIYTKQSKRITSSYTTDYLRSVMNPGVYHFVSSDSFGVYFRERNVRDGLEFYRYCENGVGENGVGENGVGDEGMRLIDSTIKLPDYDSSSTKNNNNATKGKQQQKPTICTFTTQLVHWSILLILMKSTLLLILSLTFHIFPNLITQFSTLIFKPVRYYPGMELVIVMIVGPIVMNGVQFWVFDNFLKAQ